MQGRRRYIKKKVFRVALFFFSLSALLYAKRDWIFQEFKHSLEKAISQKLKARVEMGEISGGFLRKITFRDLSISDETKSFCLIARQAHFNFRVWDILFKRYSSLDQVLLEVEDVDFFRQDFRFPFKILQAQVYLANGLLQIHNLRGSLGRKIPFEVKATIEGFQDPLGKIKLNCRFFPPLQYKNIPLFFPAVIYLNGDLDKLFLKGSGDNLDSQIWGMEGEILVRERKFRFLISSSQGSSEWTELYLDEGRRGLSSSQLIFMYPARLILSGDFSQTNRLNLKLSFDHWRLLNNELLSNIFMESEFISSRNLLQGKVWSSGSVLNYSPLPEFEGFYKLKPDNLKISYLKWTDAFVLSGNLNFKEEISGNLLVLLRNFNLANFSRIYYPQWYSWGTVDGKIRLDIERGELLLSGDINFSEGLLGPFKFRGGWMRIQGENNILKIVESRVYQEKGYSDLFGEVDLKKLGKPDFGKKLVVVTSQEHLNWQGWRVSGKDAFSGMAIDKDIDEKLSIGFKTYIEQGLGLIDERRSEMDLEYKLDEDKNLKVRLKENEELFGLEHKIRF